jgi:hypothetical protein
MALVLYIHNNVFSAMHGKICLLLSLNIQLLDENLTSDGRMSTPEKNFLTSSQGPAGVEFQY